MDWEDRISVGTLLFLYTLQGIPMGLCGSLPLILKENGASYESLSLFSLVSMPFSLKILWAPFVDTFYFKTIGRRKSWIVPTQLITGFFMLLGSWSVQRWLQSTNNSIVYLTGYFTFLYLLMATQDVAVDGWALTMLSKEYVGWASICNSVGQTIGVFLANQVFLALSDKEWCQSYLGQNFTIDLPHFMRFWGFVFISFTIGLWYLKHEEEEGGKKDESEVKLVSTSDDHKLEEVESEMLQTYRDIMRLGSLPGVRLLLLILLTCKLSYAPMDAAFLFKLQELGMTKSEFATISPVFITINLLVPSLAHETIAKRPLLGFKIGLYMKLCISLASVLIISYLQYQQNPEGTAGTHHPNRFTTIAIFFVLSCSEGASTLVFSSVMSFFSKISDPAIGGSSMTLFNTTMNLGSKWPAVLSLFLIPKFTFTHCEVLTNHSYMRIEATCSPDSMAASSCSDVGGHCIIDYDGYCLIALVAALFGSLWLSVMHSKLTFLEALPHSEWQLSQSFKARRL